MKLLAVDGNSIINRAYYGVRPLTTSDGTFTNAVFGFISIMLKMLDEVKPDCVAVAFDLKSPTFRHRMYDGYKAGRHKAPDELISQFPLIRRLIELWGFSCIDCEGFEADDILGTLARSCREKGVECVIATGDRDSLQLIGGGVTVRLAKTSGGKAESELLNEDAIMERYGVTPRQLIEVKSIMGDSSDNIPGVTGIGEKGALMLIQAFGSLDGVYENIDDSRIRQGMRDKLINCRDNAYLSRTLAEIVTDAPIDRDAESYAVRTPDSAELKKFLTSLEMFSLIPRMPCESETVTAASEPAPTITPVDDIGKSLAFTLCEDGSAVLCGEKGVKTVPLSELSALSDLITDDTKAAVAAGLPVTAIKADVTLAAYLINPSATDYSVPRLCEEYGIVMPLAEGFEDADAAARAYVLPAVADITGKKITDLDMESLLYDMEIPLAGVLAEMEKEGFLVDVSAIEKFGQELSAEINELENKIYELAGESFNINSPKQLGEILFSPDKLDLPAPKKNSRGYSTDAATLDSIRGMHPIVDMVLKYRQYAKLLSTYCDGLKKAVDSDGRVRSTYNQTETRTGRISSSEPNLQNIPVRTELGREMRKFFVAKEGCVLIDADYSQIELRVLAHLSEDDEMCRAFNEDGDIHTRTAAQIFNVEPYQVTPLMRSRAKTVNFGIVYGISAFSLAKDLHISRKEAETYISSYMATFSGVAEFMEKSIADAKESGAAVTMFNRRRLLPEIKASNFVTRSFGERVARNMPIQGAAADIIKLAMVKVSRRLKEEGLSARLILQVHDELIVESSESEAQKVAELLAYEMEHVVSMRVPLKADAHIGKTWFDAK